MSSGQRANRAGQRVEDFVCDILEERGYLYIEPLRFMPMRELEQPIYTRQFTTGADIYRKNRRVDVMLYHPQKHPECLVIQCKWQASRGSVEEKYPYEVLNIATTAYPTIIVLDGGGYSAGARAWLEKQAGKSNLIAVMSQGDVSRYASNGGFGSSSR